MESQTDQPTEFLDDLLDLWRMGAGKLEPKEMDIDLTALVLEVVVEQRLAWPARSIDFDPEATKPVRVLADPQWVGDVVANWLTNALEYSPDDQPVEVRIEAEGDTARVCVRDDGAGLPSEEQERVWERFHRAAGIRQQSGSGAGLGLYISRTIVHGSHGEAGMESMLGQGSTFWCALPLARSAIEDG
jgi:signal transduction histidine kinase